MTGVFLSRAQYDSLITHCGSWMEHRWASYDRRWHLGGVWVKGTSGQIENLLAQIEWVESLHGVMAD